MVFRDRASAGRALAEALRAYAGRDDVVVLALPRGGVPVGYEIARALDVPLDVFVVRKLGTPGQEELAMGAIASGGVRVVNDEVVRAVRVSDQMIESVAAEQEKELSRRERAYRQGRPPLEVAGKQVILVDDGLATGSTMRAAALALKQRKPARIVIAVPVGAPEVCRRFHELVDEVICLHMPEPFQAVGYWYDDFGQTTDDEVRELLERAREQQD